MKCIIYGLGSGRFKVEKYIKNEHYIIGYSDSFYKGNEFNRKKFYKPEELLNIEFDYIIIAIGEEKIFNDVYEKLCFSGIEHEKVIKFYALYEIRTLKNVSNRDFMLSQSDKFDGIIMGLSHARDGIDTHYLNGDFFNMAIGGQDLYYNFKQLKYIQENYYCKIENLKYAILDMYTYTYFNYDVSLSSGAVDYYWYSGFKDDQNHNFNYNTKFKETIEKYVGDISKKLKRYENYYCNHYLRFRDLFNSDFKEKLTEEEITDEEVNEIKANNAFSSIQTKVYKKTIEENIRIFEKILNILFGINKDIKIYLVLIPQYIETEKRIHDIEKNWKKMFFEILEKFKEKYNFEILDLKNNKEISAQKQYYYNYGHLNHVGAIAFTKLLNSYIK